MKIQTIALLAAALVLPLHAETTGQANAAAPAAAPADTVNDQDLLDTYAGNPTLENAARILALESVDTENATYRQGFCSQLIRQHSARLGELLQKADSLHSPAVRLLTCISLWLADTPESNKEAATTLEYDPIIAAYSRITPQSRKPNFTKLEELSASPAEAMALDMAWGAYDATRSRDILCSFIRCATRSAAPEKPYKLWFVTDGQRQKMERGDAMDIVSMAAKWSVQSRAKANPAFAAELQACLSTLPADIQARWKEPLPGHIKNNSEYTPNPTPAHP